MLEHILHPTINLKRLLRRAIPLLLPLALACGGDGKSKLSEILAAQPSQPSGSTAHYQQTAKTDAQGRANLSVRNFDLTTKLTDEKTGAPLSGIDVAAADHGDVYRLLAVDPAEKYASFSRFIPLSRLTKPATAGMNEGIDLNATLGEFLESQPRLFESKDPTTTTRSKEARKIATIPLPNLFAFYQANDTLVKNAGIFEFMLDTTGEYFKITQLQLASTLNKERNKFLSRMSRIQNAVLGTLAKYHGKEYDIWAHYYDIYETQTPLGIVLTHRENQDRLCTLIGSIYLRYGNEKIPIPTKLKIRNASTGFQQESPGSFSTQAFFNLPEGQYLVSMIEPGYAAASETVTLKYSIPPFLKATRAEMFTSLDAAGITSIRKVRIRARSTGDDTAVWFDFESGRTEKAVVEFNPPSPRYDLWIEPRDPELSAPRDGLRNIIYVGQGELSSVRQAPRTGYVEGYLEGIKDTENKPVKWGIGSTFVVKTQEGNFAKLRITSLERVGDGYWADMGLEYRLTGNPQGIFPE